ncbi:MAG: NAD-dependent epimerase/dehydratase family protein, partial [Alphaproteobacteria bacterium]|nr:NAD-dependent epimerase/dehydratase family protein [Alphaproteobacteria bacterium]
MILKGKSILVTGGTGSLGRILVKRILSGELGRPRKVIVFSRDEAKQNDMRLAYTHRGHEADQGMLRNFMSVLEFRIGDVRDYSDVCTAMRSADIVINAAALKQVPTCEYFPEQALLTNCVGAVNIVRA